LLKTLAVRPAEVKTKKVFEALDHLKAKALVNKFAATLEEMEAKTIGGTLRDVENEKLVNTTADWPQKVTVRIMTIFRVCKKT